MEEKLLLHPPSSIIMPASFVVLVVCWNLKHIFYKMQKISCVSLILHPCNKKMKLFFVYFFQLRHSWKHTTNQHNSVENSYLLCTFARHDEQKKTILFLVTTFKVILLSRPCLNHLVKIQKCKPRHTHPNFRVCARWKVPADCFKICHTFRIRIPM